MGAGAQIGGWDGPSRRRVPRYRMQAPLDVTVLRSGIPDTVPGRSLNVCERGIAAVLAGELLAGESVGIELQLSPPAEPLRSKASVRYHDKLRCGLEFVGLTAQQRASIRDWAIETKAVLEDASLAVPADATKKKQVEKVPGTPGSTGPSKPTKRRRRGWPWLVGLLALVAIAAAIWWWRWNRGWAELESLKDPNATTGEKPRAQVPAEVMQKLLVHRVEPVYPAEARKERLEGTIALDIIVGRDGSVVSMRALNGPDVLARAAMDALRWWKFEPYRINGEAAVVETTVAVEFKR